jgi:5-methyltetrahydropteroyltriglutamate--homocysteine methyltransferase
VSAPAPRAGPPFRADHVGSLLRSREVLAARADFERGALSAAALRAIEDGHIRRLVATQESIGLRGVTDGECRRASWQIDFLRRIEGIEVREGTFMASFKRADGQVQFVPQTLAVTSRLRRSAPILLDDFRFLASVARATPKITLPSPVWLHFRSDRDSVSRDAYPDLDGFTADLVRVYREELADLAAAGCTYVQLDETSFAHLCDPNLREQTRARGRDPDRLLDDYVALINAVTAGRPPALKVCMHTCRGNFRSAWVSSGGYDPVAEKMLGGLDLDGFFLEYDDERSGDFEPLRYLPEGRCAVLGLVTSKRAGLETRDALLRRIEAASRCAPIERLCLSPQCGFSSTVEGNELTERDQWAKLELVVAVAGEVWG